MLRIRPVIAIGIGPRAEETIRHYVQSVRARQGHVPAILPAIVAFADVRSVFHREINDIQRITLSPPVFGQEDDWPAWLPAGLADMPPAERARTRAWMRAAMLQQADELQEFLLESIPHLSSFGAIEEMDAAGVSLVGDGQIGIYVIADLSDLLGSSIAVDVSYLTFNVCKQLGLQPTTTGLLFLPDATSPAPVEEAIAYAALKEIEFYFTQRSYNGGFAPDWAKAEGQVPFSDGCYLLDRVNELGYTLEDPAQQISTMGEWLYTMTLLDMQGAMHEHRRRRYATATLRGRSRAYDGFGMAIRYVPKAALVNWATARLGHSVIQRLLRSPIDGDSEQRARAFVLQSGLEAGVLGDQLARRTQDRGIEETLSPLGSARFGQIESRARQVLQVIREKHLPQLDRSLADVSEQKGQEVCPALHQQVQVLLQGTLGGSLVLAQRFLERLRELVSALQVEVEEQSKQHRVELKQSLSTISKTYYTLRSVMMSIPPWPVSALSVLVLLVLPLLYVTGLIAQVVRPANLGWGLAALGVLGCGVLGVIGFVVLRLWRQKSLVSSRHKHMIRQRFDLEGRPLISRGIRSVYSAMQTAIEEELEELEPLIAEVESVAMRFEQQASRVASELQGLSAPGPFRSVIDPERVEQLLSTLSINADQLLGVMTQQIGAVADWRLQAASRSQPLSLWLTEQISSVSAQFLEQRIHRINVLDAITQASPQASMEEDLRRMFEAARPLWSYDPQALRRAKTQRMTLLGVDTSGSAWARVVIPLSRAYPDLVPINTNDSFTMVVLRVHRGMPLFALRRIGEYRTHYAEMLWHSKLPVHTTHDLALAEDLIPPRRRTRLVTSVLFAAGLALGSIRRDASGRYLVPNGRGDQIRLSAHKERAVALMTMVPAACQEVQRQLDAVVAGKGSHAVQTILDEYLTVVPNLEDWEVKGITGFVASYDLDDAELEDESIVAHAG